MGTPYRPPIHQPIDPQTILRSLGVDETGAPAPQETEGLSAGEKLQMFLSMIPRVAGPVAGMVKGGTIGSAFGPVGTGIGAILGGAIGGAGGEAVGQLVEPRSEGIRPGGIVAGAATGAIPGSWMSTPIKGGLIGLGSTAAYKLGEGDITDWGPSDFLPAIFGTGIGYALNRGTRAATKPPASTPTPDVPPPTPTTLEDLIARRSRPESTAGTGKRTVPLVATSPKDIDRAAALGEATGGKLKITSPTTTEDVVKFGLSKPGETPEQAVTSIESLIKQAEDAAKQAPHTLLRTAARVESYRPGTISQDGLTKLAQAQDVEAQALRMAATGDKAGASALRKSAVSEGTASSTTSRAVIREQAENVSQEAKNLGAREKFLQKSAEETAKADRIAKMTEGMTAQDPVAVLKTSQDIPGVGTETVTQRFVREAAEEGERLPAVQTAGDTPALSIAQPTQRTVYPTRDEAVRNMDRFGAVGVVKAPAGKGYVHVFDPTTAAPAAAAAKELPEQTFATWAEAQSAAKKVGGTVDKAVDPATKKTRYFVVESEGAQPVLKVGNAPADPNKLYPTMSHAQSAAKSLGRAGTVDDVEKVVEGGKTRYRVKSSPLVDEAGAGTQAAAKAGEVGSQPLDPTLQAASPTRQDELLTKFGGTKEAPEARDANPMNVNFVERRAAAQAGRLGGRRSTDPVVESLTPEATKQASDDIARNPNSVDPATREAIEAKMFDIAEAEANAGNPKLADRLKGEAGQAAILPVLRIAGGAAGALGGAAMSPEDPTTGAIVGGFAGAMAPGALIKAYHALKSNPAASRRDLADHGEKVREVANKFVEWFPDLYRANILAHPINLPLNVFVGPLGSAMMAGIERFVAKDPIGIEILKRVFNPKVIRQAYRDSEIEAWDRILSAESRAEGAGRGLATAPEWLRRIGTAPGVAMTRGDIMAQRILLDAGLSEAQARTITLTSEPFLPISKRVRSFAQTAEGEKDSFLGRVMLPFHRTALNQMEQSLLRFPGVALLVQKHTDEAPPELGLALARQGIGAGVLASSYFLGLVTPPEARWQVRKLLDNVGGQYGMLASTSFMAGQFAAGGSDWGGVPAAVGSITESDLPIPKGDAIRDILSARNLVDEPTIENVPWSYIPFGGAGRFIEQMDRLMNPKPKGGGLYPLREGN